MTSLPGACTTQRDDPRCARLGGFPTFRHRRVRTARRATIVPSRAPPRALNCHAAAQRYGGVGGACLCLARSQRSYGVVFVAVRVQVYCPLGSTSPLTVADGMASAGGTPTTRTWFQWCGRGHYCLGGERFVWPVGMVAAACLTHCFSFPCARGKYSRDLFRVLPCTLNCSAGFVPPDPAVPWR